MKSNNIRKKVIVLLLISAPALAFADPKPEVELEQGIIETIMQLALGSTNQSPP